MGVLSVKEAEKQEEDIVVKAEHLPVEEKLVEKAAPLVEAPAAALPGPKVASRLRDSDSIIASSDSPPPVQEVPLKAAGDAEGEVSEPTEEAPKWRSHGEEGAAEQPQQHKGSGK
eukprot:10741763-Lingulodinium_polyedra.AAC.1